MDKVPKAEFQAAASQLFDIRETVKRPENYYFRFVDTEDDSGNKVEYDMDEQGTKYKFVVIRLDSLWLKAANSRRKFEGLPPVAEDIFENVIDILEKQWFHLTKDLIKSNHQPLTHEESICQICNDGEVENSNAIVFCDGCNLAVHQGTLIYHNLL
jgi:hypothetical protein